MELKNIFRDGNSSRYQYEFVFDIVQTSLVDFDYWCLVIYHDLEYRLRNYAVGNDYLKDIRIDIRDVPENVLKVYKDVVSDPLFEIEYERFKGL